MLNRNDEIYVIISDIEVFLEKNSIEYQSIANQINIYPDNCNQITITIDKNIKINSENKKFNYNNTGIEPNFYKFLKNYLKI